jgi:hypothetical protein
MFSDVSVYCPYCHQKTTVSPAPLAIPGNLVDTPIRQWITPDPYYRYGGERWWLSSDLRLRGRIRAT